MGFKSCVVTVAVVHAAVTAKHGMPVELVLSSMKIQVLLQLQ